MQALQSHVGGCGVVIRHARLAFQWGDIAKPHDVASAMKPLLSTLLLFAIQEQRLAGPDEPVARFEPRLRDHNSGKDAAITWRHLASQTSGYGLAEPPGTAWAYNDYAIALYYDTLTSRVFQEDGTALLRRLLAEPLHFQDPCTFDAFRRAERRGRLEVSVRDFARFGLLVLREGRWEERQFLRPDLVRMTLQSPVPPGLPRTSGQESDLLPGQRTVGGTRNITPIGPGFYSFNWWLNRTNAAGQPLFVDAPPDTIVASGHGGQRVLWLFPSWDLIVCWNNASITDHDTSPGNRDSRCNQAARLIRQAVESATRP